MRKLMMPGLSVLVVALLSCQPQVKQLTRTELLTNSAKTFIEILARENYTEAEKNFTEELKTKLPPDKLRDAWQQTVSHFGAFKGQLDAQTARMKEGDAVYDVVVVKCQFEREAINIRVAFNERDQITGLFFVAAT